MTEYGGGGDGDDVVDCPTQLTVVIRRWQLCSITNTSEKYGRTQQENLPGMMVVMVMVVVLMVVMVV